LETGAPLLPIATWGGRALWPVGSPFPRPRPGRRVPLLVGEPLTAAPLEGETAQQAALRATDELMGRVAAPLGRLHDPQPASVLHDVRRDTHRAEIGRPQRGYRTWKQTSP